MKSLLELTTIGFEPSASHRDICCDGCHELIDAGNPVLWLPAQKATDELQAFHQACASKYADAMVKT